MNALVDLPLHDQFGHLIRRAQQISVSMFRDTVQLDMTPTQYAVLRMLQEAPGIDQLTLAGLVALDRSSTAEIAVRLEAKGWVQREMLPRGRRCLTLTVEGETVLASMASSVLALHDKLLAKLSPEENIEFSRLLKKFVHLNNESSRAPLQVVYSAYFTGVKKPA
jgi:DNA-binding MarR family transcriptional regulator